MLVNYTYSTNEQLSRLEARAKGFPTGGENQIMKEIKCNPLVLSVQSLTLL